MKESFWMLFTWTWKPTLYVLLGVTGVMAVVALVSPATFRKVASGSSKWVDSYKFLQALDKPIDVDSHVLRYSRTLGVVALVSVLYLSWLLMQT